MTTRADEFDMSEFQTMINPDYTFETLVEGKFNLLALATSKMIIGNINQQKVRCKNNNFNPLTIIADTGLGKTHLLHAIANKIINNQPECHCILINADNFIEAMIVALKNREIEAFKAYFKYIDVILIDDIDRFIDKERSQDELIHLINYWLEQKKIMVFTSRRLTTEMDGFNERLKSRIKWGLAVNIDEPGQDDILKLIEYRIKQSNITLSYEVKDYLAEQFNYNLNGLFAALNYLLALSQLKQKEMTLHYVKKHIETLFHTGKKSKKNNVNNYQEEFLINHDFIPIRDLLTTSIDTIDSVYMGELELDRIMTGFIDLDKITYGFKPGELVVIAGRPCMGTFDMGINIITHVATQLKKGVALFSLNINSQDVTQHLIASMSAIELNRIEDGELYDNDWSRLTDVVSSLAESTIFIDDCKCLDFASLKTKAKQLCKQDNIDLIVIDNLQLIERKTKTYQTKYSKLIQSIRNLASKLSLPVILLSSVSEHVENRPNKRPVLYDLSHYGNLDEVADSIIFLYRDELYNESSPDKGTIEVNVDKQRFGTTGTIQLNYKPQYSQLYNIENIY